MGLAPDVLAAINKARASRGEPLLARGPSFYDPTPLEDVALINRIADDIWGPTKPKKERNEMPKREWKRENVWLRMLLMAPTGGGKTLAALAVASTLFDGKLPVAAIDTEYERMKLYADAVGISDYRVIENDFSPESYIREIDEVEAEFPGGVLVIDSVTHEWSGSHGVLQIVDSKGGGNWKEGTPRHNKFVDRLMLAQMHVIVCCRSKMKYEYSTNEQGKRKQEKLGIGPEQRDNFLYNFDVVGDIDAESHLTTFTNRCRPLVDKSFNLVPDIDDLRAPNPVSAILTAWLSEGDPPTPPVEAPVELVDELRALLLAEGRVPVEKIEESFVAIRSKNRGALPPEWVAEKIASAKERADAAATAAAAVEQNGSTGETEQALEAALSPE